MLENSPCLEGLLELVESLERLPNLQSLRYFRILSVLYFSYFHLDYRIIRNTSLETLFDEDSINLRMYLLARIPQITQLNLSHVRSKEKETAERYYINWSVDKFSLIRITLCLHHVNKVQNQIQRNQKRKGT